MMNAYHWIIVMELQCNINILETGDRISRTIEEQGTRPFIVVFMITHYGIFASWCCDVEGIIG